MFDGTVYLWLKALHIIAVIAWMAGLLYLPRLYVYHAAAEPGSELSETLKIMERRLLRAIMNPAMLVALIAGGILLTYQDFSSGWLHVKLLCIAGLLAMHMMMGKWRKDFEADRNTRSDKFYRFANEVPTILMIVIVVMAVVKPF
ncbi:protoporphyrinogen oxidase HemJ [Thalassospiraceae bacterium LMO-JJ14]|nr:protoporphyrinogen oxidase HemJ [Thalassospiraceae bacterium LMO-JJ14]